MNSQTLQLLLVLAFVLVLIVAIIAGLIGLLKGIYKTALKTLLKAVFVIVLVFVTPTLADSVGAIDISKFINAEKGTSIQSYLVDILYTRGMISPINGMSIYETSIALVDSAISVAVFFVGLLFVQLTISLITAIIYNGVFRWFLPVETKKERKLRKKKKKENPGKGALTVGLENENGEVVTDESQKRRLPLLKIPSAVLGACQEFIFVCLLLTPITAIARIAVNNKDSINRTLENAGYDENEIENVNMYIDVTEQSLLYKMLGVANFDTTVMNKATSVDINETSVSLLGIIDSAFDIAAPLLENGSVTYDRQASTVTVNFSLLLASSTVDSLVKNVISQPMLMALIPPLIDVAMNSIEGSSFAIDDLDFSGVDWSNDLSALNDIYSIVYEGSIKPIVNEGGIDYKNFSIKTTTMTDEEIDEYANALKRLGEMESVKKNIAVILSGVGATLINQGFEILPTDVSAYDEVDWSNDLSIIGKNLLRLFRTVGSDITADFNVNLFRDNVYKAMADETKRNELSELICGSDTDEGLLDTDLFSRLSLGDIVGSTLSSITSIEKYVNQIDFNSILDNLSQEELKREFSTMFDIAGMIFDEESPLYIDKLSNIDIFDSDTAIALSLLLKKSEESTIFMELYPPIMKGILFHTDIDFSSNLFGLSPYHFNYDSEDFVENLRQILELLPDIKSMQDLFNDSSKTNKEKLESLDTAVLRRMISLIVNSDFFNADHYTGTTSVKQKNTNIHTLFTNLFKEEVFSSLGLVVPSIEKMQLIDWGTGVGGDGGEIDRLCSLIDSAKSISDFVFDDNHSLSSLDNPRVLTDMVKEGMQSTLLSDSILNVIDKTINQYFEELGIPLSLDEMRNSLWIDDSDYLGDLLCLIKNMDLSDIDLDTIDTDRLNSILTILYHLNLIQTSSNNNDPYGYAIYSLMEKQGLFTEFGIQHYSSSIFDLSKQERGWIKQEGLISFDGDTYSYPYTVDGEISDFIGFIKVAQQYGFDELSNGKLPSGFIDAIEPYLGSSVLRRIMVSTIKSTVKQVSLPSGYEGVLDSIDFEILLTLSPSEFKDELSVFELLYRYSTEKIDDKTKLERILDDIFNLSSVSSATEDDPYRTLMDDFDDVIDAITGSRLFTSVKDGYSLSPFALLMKSMVKQTGLSEKVTMQSSENYQEMTLVAILKDIADWKTEGNYIKTTVLSLQGLDLEHLELSGSKLTKEQASSLFTEMNRSALFHRVPISVLETSFEEKGIDDMLKDPETETVTFPMNFRVHLTTSETGVSFWQNEYDNIVEMVFGDGGLKDFFANEDSKFSDATFNDVDVKFLYYLGCMKLFENNRSYIVANFVNSYSVSTFSALSIYQKAESTPYGLSSTVYRFEELFFRNPVLLDDNGNLDKEKALKDLSCLDGVIHEILAESIIASTGHALSNLTIDFEKMTSKCVVIDGTEVYRSSFASESVGGLMSKILKNTNFTLFADASEFDFYSDDYRLVNIIEGRAFNAFINLDKADKSSGYISKDTLASILPYCGDTLIDTEESDIKNQLEYFSKYSEYSSLGNSLVASSIGDQLMKIYVLPVDSSTPVMIKDITTLDYTNSSFGSIHRSLDIQ